MEEYSDPDLILRPFNLSDADDFLQWYRDEKVSNFCSWDSDSSKEAAIAYFENEVMGHPWHKAICLMGRAVGSISISPFEGKDRCRAEIGYVLASNYWGKGIATMAVKMAANAVFAEWRHLERLEAVVVVENMGSQRVLQKAGFMREGILRKYYLLKGTSRDVVMFSLLNTDL